MCAGSSRSRASPGISLSTHRQHRGHSSSDPADRREKERGMERASTSRKDQPPEERVKARAEGLLPEEQAVGSDDPERQAKAVLDESDERVSLREVDLAEGERRASEDTVE